MGNAKGGHPPAELLDRQAMGTEPIDDDATGTDEETKMTDEQATPEDVIRSLNAAWVEGRCDDMLPLLDDRAVVVQPDFLTRSSGPDEIVAGFEDFVQNANIIGYDETDFATDVFDDTAIVTYRFDIGYEMDGELSRDTGHDMFVLKRDAGEWKVVWRTLIPDGERL